MQINCGLQPLLNIAKKLKDKANSSCKLCTFGIANALRHSLSWCCDTLDICLSGVWHIATSAVIFPPSVQFLLANVHGSILQDGSCS